MEDYKLVIYIVLGALYYGYKFLAKNKEAKDNEPKNPTPTSPSNKNDGGWSSTPPKRPSTIQELLEEVKKEKEAYEKPVHRPFYETQETLNYETIDYETTPEKAKVESINPYQEYRTLNVENFADTAPRFAEYATKPKPKHPILNVFKAKDKVKEAFIMSEIFARKQF